jgi:predicted transcriptional regulator
MSTPLLTPELEDALSQGGGFVHGQSFILMSVETYRDMMGVGTDEEMRASLDAIHRGLDDIEAGRTHDMDDVFRELDEAYGTTG